MIVHQDSAGLARIKAATRFISEETEAARPIFRLD